MIKVPRFFGPLLGIALTLSASARAQNSTTAYAWSAYPNPDVTLFFPTGVAADAAGNVYGSLLADHTITKISAAGTVTTFAGSPSANGSVDATGTDARFNGPQGLAVDGTGVVYVADFGNSTIRKISPAGTVFTVAGAAGLRGKADGPSTVARFASPRGVALDTIGNIYVTDSANSTIRLITLDNHTQTIAGGTYGSRDSVGLIAQFMMPWGIALDQEGNVFVTDGAAHTVRKISAVVRLVSTVAGSPGSKGSSDGPGNAARFYEPTGITVDRAGNLFVTDTQNHTIRRISPDGQVTTIGGRADVPGGTDNGVGAAARFLSPYAITVTPTGILYVADYLGIRRGEPVRAPVISTQPLGLIVREGTRASLTVVATGAPAPTYQWQLNGAPVADATNATLTFAPVRAEHGGNYTVVVTNSIGAVTSSVAAFTVNSPPKISVAPQPTLIGANGTAVLSVTALSAGPVTYQWLRNGDRIVGATHASLTVDAFGNYSVAVTNAFGTSTSGAARVEFPSRLINLSASGSVGSGATSLVSGVVVAAPAGVTKRLLIRAVGPSLSKFGVPNAVPLTVVSLLDQSGRVVARNSGWATHPLATYNEIADTAYGAGAFALSPGSGDSALLVDVPRGNYTVSVEAAPAGTTGRCLVEIYEVNEDAARLTNLSTRGQIVAGSGLTVGFVTIGAGAPRLLVRATGPGLDAFGVVGALRRPVLTLFHGGRIIATNTGWSNATNALQLEQTAAAVGAFAFTRNSADSALLLTLESGENYTAEVTSADGTLGAVLVEIYQVP